MPEIVSGNPVNQTPGYTPVNHSSFNLSRMIGCTTRFADITPMLATRIIPADKRVKFAPTHDLRSYTLKSPLMQEIKKLNSYFFVARQALLPYNWEKLEKNPKFGDDVDASVVGTSVTGLRTKIAVMCRALTVQFKNYLNEAEEPTFAIASSYLFRWLIFLEQFYSTGSIFSALNCHLHNEVEFENDSSNFDDAFDFLVREWFSKVNLDLDYFYFTSNGRSYTFSFDSNRSPSSTESVVNNVHEFLDILRDNSGFVDFVGLDDISIDDIDFVSDYVNDIRFRFYTISDTQSIELESFWAYQLACAEYFTNDNVDHIFSAELFRQYICSLIKEMEDESLVSFASFDFNGVSTPYDYLSAYYFNQISQAFTLNLDDIEIGSDVHPIFAYFTALTYYRKSLRYEDYFVGSRKWPLAVGDVTVDTSGIGVSVMQITQKMMTSKYLLASNRAKNGIKGYINEIFHADMAHDMHNPMWLANTMDKVYSPEVENTGVAQLERQNSVTSVFRSTDSKFAFEFESSLPGVLIGVEYFDLHRLYPEGIERQYNPVDRYERYNPFMQYIGDQPIYLSELSGLYDETPFSYTNRYMEYKQLPDYCYGGFIRGYIDGFAYIYERDIDELTRLSSRFIRNRNFELDRFYTSLIGLSLGHYFHFIIMRNNELHASRDMAYAPGILSK